MKIEVKLVIVVKGDINRDGGAGSSHPWCWQCSQLRNEWSQDELGKDSSSSELKCTQELGTSRCIMQGAQLRAL